MTANASVVITAIPAFKVLAQPAATIQTGQNAQFAVLVQNAQQINSSVLYSNGSVCQQLQTNMPTNSTNLSYTATWASAVVGTFIF